MPIQVCVCPNKGGLGGGDEASVEASNSSCWRFCGVETEKGRRVKDYSVGKADYTRRDRVETLAGGLVYQSTVEINIAVHNAASQVRMPFVGPGNGVFLSFFPAFISFPLIGYTHTYIPTPARTYTQTHTCGAPFKATTIKKKT
jgi:hypothetical protein